jgi:DNA-binding transcriptional LysR family regulator
LRQELIQDSLRASSRARLVACVSPGYLKKHGVPEVPEDLVNHQCLTYAHISSPNEWRFRRSGVERRILVSGSLRANSGDILRNAATEDLGVMLQPDFLIFEALRERKLVRILTDWETDELGVFAVYPNRKFLLPKVRNFIDFLVERFGPEPYWSWPPINIASAQLDALPVEQHMETQIHGQPARGKAPGASDEH